MQRIDTIIPVYQQLIWLNRDQIKRVQASSKRACNGALIVQQTVIPSGFDIQIGTTDGWMMRTDFDALKQHNATNLEPFELVMGDDTFSVIWDNTADLAISGSDLYTSSNGHDTLTNVTMKFITV